MERHAESTLKEEGGRERGFRAWKKIRRRSSGGRREKAWKVCVAMLNYAGLWQGEKRDAQKLNIWRG